MAEHDHKPESGGLTRRDFIQTVAAGGAGLLLSQTAFGQVATTTTATSKLGAPAILSAGVEERVNVGVIGVGAEGRVLVDAALRSVLGHGTPNIKIKAVCDIWEYNRKYAQRYVKALKQGDVAAYEDYREMLADAQKLGLEAVIVATPDWLHAEQTIAALEAGLHCYCEKEMATSLEDARRMVLAARRTGKLLQIGRQRRSNPRYRYALDELIRKRGILGQVTFARAQWNRPMAEDVGWPRGAEIAPQILARYGYESMHHFRNWRAYRKYGSGPAASMGGHQIDVLNWFLDAHPKNVIANGVRDSRLRHEWCDNLMCLFEYDTSAGTVLASYQAGAATSCEGHTEIFLGGEGELVMSEDNRATRVTSDAIYQGKWGELARENVLTKRPEDLNAPVVLAKVRESNFSEDFLLPIEFQLPYHQPHLQNFCDAIRKGTPLSCPGEVGYATAVVTLAINRAIETGQKIVLKPEDFVVA